MQKPVDSWFPDGERYISKDTNYYYVVNRVSGNSVPIVRNCQYRFYGFFSISNDGSKMISSGYSYTYIGHNTLFMSINIIIMNTDGTNEQVIDIPG